jgi:hypothetical protein
VSNETGRHEVYIRSFTGGPAAADSKVQVSVAGGEFPVWRDDGRELYYMSGDFRIQAVNTSTLHGPAAVPPPMALFKACPGTVPNGIPGRGEPFNQPYDTLDGQRFVLHCRAEPPGKFVVLVNWNRRL